MKNRDFCFYSEQVSNWIHSQNLISADQNVCCALSGGADSVAMTLLLSSLRDFLHIQVSAVHVNHGIRGEEADRDEAFCRDFCTFYQIPLKVFKGDAPSLSKSRKIGLEEAARELRYRFFDQIDCDRIAVAHTADDNLETCLWHMCRGGGARGLSGIPFLNGKIIRPILCLSRQDTESVCMMCKAAWVTDSTNLNDDCVRNVLRHRVTPILREINPSVSDHVLQNSLRLREEDFFLDQMARDALSKRDGKLTRDGLIENGKVIARRMIRIKAAESDINLSGEMVEKILLTSISDRSRFSLDVPGGKYLAEYGEYVFWQNSEHHSEPFCVILKPGEVIQTELYKVVCSNSLENEKIYKKFNLFMISHDKIQGDLVLRNTLPDDVFKRNSGSGSKKLSRIFSDMKIPFGKRKTMPVIADERGVLYVPGLGYNRLYINEQNESNPMIIVAFDSEDREEK